MTQRIVCEIHHRHVFMLDDAAIFVIAMMSLAATGMTGRYLRVSHLLGGIGMIAIGALLLFAAS